MPNGVRVPESGRVAAIVCDSREAAAAWARHDYGAAEVLEIEPPYPSRNGRHVYRVHYLTAQDVAERAQEAPPGGMQ